MTHAQLQKALTKLRKSYATALYENPLSQSHNEILYEFQQAVIDRYRAYRGDFDKTKKEAS